MIIPYIRQTNENAPPYKASVNSGTALGQFYAMMKDEMRGVLLFDVLVYFIYIL